MCHEKKKKKTTSDRAKALFDCRVAISDEAFNVKLLSANSLSLHFACGTLITLHQCPLNYSFLG